jgi:hypothetical protein
LIVFHVPNSMRLSHQCVVLILEREGFPLSFCKCHTDSPASTTGFFLIDVVVSTLVVDSPFLGCFSPLPMSSKPYGVQIR